MEIDELKADLENQKTKVTELTEKLQAAQLEKQLAGKLAQAGAIDIEGALAIAKEKIASDNLDINQCVDELKKQKHYLFTTSADKVTIPGKTAGARDKGSGQTLLEKAAQKAAKTGNRADLHEYLRLRRAR